MVKKISWVQAAFISAISAIAALVCFLLLQIVWGDVVKSSIRSSVYHRLYFNVNLILFIGLAFAFLTSFLTNVIVFKREYYAKGLFYANIFSFIFTALILLLISWLSVLVIYWESYSELSFIEEIYLIPYLYLYFGIYILQNAVLFWYIALIAYHVSLIPLIKLFYKKKKLKRKAIESKPLYTSSLQHIPPGGKKK